MPATADLYDILGVSANATPADIKKAFRSQAKTAHPDAGGSVEAMARLNEAYQILIDPAARRAYDAAEVDVEPEPTAAPPPPKPAAAAGHQTHRPEVRPRDEFDAEMARHWEEAAHRRAAAEADAVNRGRVVWARSSAWRLLRRSFPLAVLAMLIGHYAIHYVNGTGMKLAMNAIVFLPIYGFTLSLIFLFDPALRLVFGDLAHRYPTTLQEKASAAAIIVAYFPLALIWALWR